MPKLADVELQAEELARLVKSKCHELATASANRFECVGAAPTRAMESAH